MLSRFEKFTALITKVSRGIYKIKKEEMAEYNLKSSHVSCLYYLYKENTLTAKRLCDLCGEDKANISRSIKYLESAGYIHHQSMEQKRFQNLLLTEKGEEVGKDIAEKVDRVLAEVGNGLTKEDRDILYQSLSLIGENLEKFCSKYKR